MTNKITKKAVGLFLALLVMTSVLAYSLPALAATDVWGSDQGGSASQFACDTTLGSSDLRVVIGNTIRIVIGFLGIIAVVIILIGGFKWMTAGGSEDKVGEAKKLIISGIIGLVVILFSYAIATFVLDQIAAASGS